MTKKAHYIQLIFHSPMNLKKRMLPQPYRSEGGGAFSYIISLIIIKKNPCRLTNSSNDP